MRRGLLWLLWPCILLCVVLAPPVQAETLRIATFGSDLSRRGPGLLLRDLLAGKDAQIEAVVAVIAAAQADVILLVGIDYDHDLVALRALEGLLADAGTPYEHLLALRPNKGMQSGLDLDGDRRVGGPGDAQGFGRFAGEAGMAVLSRLPLDRAALRDFSGFLWRDLPGALLSDPLPSPEVLEVQRLSSTGHWEVPVILPGGGRLRLLGWHASPPVFGRSDRNARRNHDETAFWLHLLNGALPFPPTEQPFVLLGHANLDPADGAGRNPALLALLAHPALQDPAPRSAGAAAATAAQGGINAGHRGDPALDTADFADVQEPGRGPPPGNLRVAYLLPSAGITVVASGVFWPAPGAPLADEAARASRHRLVWADLVLR